MPSFSAKEDGTRGPTVHHLFVFHLFIHAAFHSFIHSLCSTRMCSFDIMSSVSLSLISDSLSPIASGTNHLGYYKAPPP